MRSPYLIRASSRKRLSPPGRRREGPAVGARSDGDGGRLDALDAGAGREGGALGALDAVVRPEDLRAVRELDRLERLLAGMGGGKRHVSRRVPVLGEDDVPEGRRDAVDDRDDLVAAVHRQRAPGDEAVLDVDDQEHVVPARPDRGLGAGGGGAPDEAGKGEAAGRDSEKLSPIGRRHVSLPCGAGPPSAAHRVVAQYSPKRRERARRPPAREPAMSILREASWRTRR